LDYKSVAVTIMHCLEPTKERVERTNSARQQQRFPIRLGSFFCSCSKLFVRTICGVIISLHNFPISQAQDDLLQQIEATDTLGRICCSHNQGWP